MKLAKKLADFVLEKEQLIKVDTPLSVYADTFIVYAEGTGKDGAEAFIQHVLNTKFLTENENTEDEFPDIPGQVTKILKEIEISEEAKTIAEEIKRSE